MLYKENATLSISVQGGIIDTNPITLEPIFSSTSTVMVTCSLEVVKEPTTNENDGVDTKSIYMVGRAVEPKILPTEFKPNTWCDIEFKSPEGTLRTGRMLICPTVQSRLGIEAFFGSSIEGRVTFQN